MKSRNSIYFNITLLFLITILLPSCVVKQQLNQNYFNQDKRVGLLIVDTGMQKFKAGGQGLLDMALTQGKKYMPALEKAATQVSIKDSIVSLYSNIFQRKNMELLVLDEEIDFDELESAKRIESGKKYAKYDYVFLKSKHKIDDLMIVEPKYGLLISYQGFIEIYRETLCQLDTQIINLNDNSLEYKDNPYYKIKVKKEWKEAPDYATFIEMTQKTISQCMNKEYSKFNSIN